MLQATQILTSASHVGPYVMPAHVIERLGLPRAMDTAVLGEEFSQQTNFGLSRSQMFEDQNVSPSVCLPATAGI